MKLGKVIGRVWADRKVKQLHSCRLHIIQPMTSNLRKKGKPLVVADPQNIAGSNDIVVYVTSTDATQAFDSGFAPVNASVVELVDSIY
ncbi:EutN/CcmL family microcompartment protein [bacterium]|nr:EutN/CcmL family microcompartment protein [bacterium]RQV97758.1 MAG: ethanolamine utilization protein EutN [bacterium]